MMAALAIFAAMALMFACGTVYGWHLAWTHVVRRINELEAASVPCPTVEVEC